MTVANNYDPIRQEGNGVTTSFSYSFDVASINDIVVYQNIDGVQSVVPDTDYEVEVQEIEDEDNPPLNPTPTGNVVFYTPPAAGTIIVIDRRTPQTQETPYKTSSGFPAVRVEQNFDKLTLMVQELQDASNRSIKVSETSETNPDELTAQVERIYESIDNIDTVSDNITDVNTVSGISTDVSAVASNATNINAVAGNESNITAVAGNSTNINAVASNATNINTVAGDVTNINTVAGISSAVSTVASNNSNVTTVATNISDVNTVATDISNVNAVGTDIANVNSVALDLTNVDTVATNISDVNTVATDIAKVNAVAGDLTNIDSVANNATNIDKVANKIAEVDTVAWISGDVITVAGISSNITAVAGNATNINAVAGNNTNITAVAGNATNINTVAGDKTNIDKVASDINRVNLVADDIASVHTVAVDISTVIDVANNKTNIDAVAGNSTNINAVAGNETNINAVNANKTNIDAVAGNNTDISTVAADITNINAVAADLTNIDAASGYAAEAKQWAIGDPSEPTGNSAKWWAEHSGLPSQTGQSGKFLTTDGSGASWANVDALPSQTGQSGKYLTTDGTDASWANVPTRNIGEIVASTIPLSDAGLHLLDGALISGAGSYAKFVNYIAGLVTNYPDLFTTEANWQSSVTTYGVCGKFVYDSVNNTVRLPKITGFTEGTIDPTALGDLVEAGLPNITGTFTLADENYTSDYGFNLTNDNLSGCFTATAPLKPTEGLNASGTGSINQIPKFDASLSNPIYGNSSTVQPQAIKVLYYIVVATSTKTNIEVDIDEIATDLNGKADVDLSNMNPTQTVKNTIVGWSMPSSRYIDLTLGASGSTYTAPANGWFFLSKIAGSDFYYASMGSPKMFDFREAYRTSFLTPCVAVLKGDVVTVDYNATGQTSVFRFIYAEGEN